MHEIQAEKHIKRLSSYSEARCPLIPFLFLCVCVGVRDGEDQSVGRVQFYIYVYIANLTLSAEELFTFVVLLTNMQSILIETPSPKVQSGEPKCLFKPRVLSIHNHK